ncbi:hypothetical protein ACE6H2_027749 [Prunus campanulata]
MAENSNALTFKETVLQVDRLLFLVERLAIFLVIIFPKFSCFSFIYFILTTFLCMEASLQRQLVSKSTVRMFLLERLAVIVFVLYPRSATPFADFFCYSCILDLIRSALRLNPNENEQGDGYLFRIERAMAILLKLHCTNRIIFIARVVFVVTNSVFFVDSDTFEPKQKSVQKQPQQQHSGQNKPKQGQQMQGIISSVSTTHTSKFRETEIEEESAKEENTKWEEGLVEADGQLKEKAEIEAEASKEGEGDLMQEAEDQLKEKPDTEEENTKREDDLLEVDDSWEDLDSLEEVDDSWEEELVEADEIDSVCEIKNLRKKGEVEGTEEVERLRAENESLKREKYVLRHRLEREREAYEQEYQNMLKKMQEEFEGTLILERQLSTAGCHKRVG